MVALQKGETWQLSERNRRVYAIKLLELLRLIHARLQCALRGHHCPEGWLEVRLELMHKHANALMLFDSFVNTALNNTHKYNIISI